MSWTTESGQDLTGAEVFGADGDKVGTVAAVYPGYIVVEKGFFFPTDYYIPMSAVASYDNDQVYLNLAKDAALNSGWDAQPTDLETASYDTSMASTGIREPTRHRAGSDGRRDPHPGHGGRADRHRPRAGSRRGPHREGRRRRGAHARGPGDRGAGARRAARGRPAGHAPPMPTPSRRRSSTCRCAARRSTSRSRRGSPRRSSSARKPSSAPSASPTRCAGKRSSSTRMPRSS